MMLKPFFRNLMCVALGLMAGLLLPRFIGKPGYTPSSSSEPTIEQVRELSSLVTLSVDVADVQLTDLHGWTGGVRVAMLVKGQYLLGTDLGQSRFASVDRA